MRPLEGSSRGAALNERPGATQLGRARRTRASKARGLRAAKARGAQCTPWTPGEPGGWWVLALAGCQGPAAARGA